MTAGVNDIVEIPFGQRTGKLTSPVVQAFVAAIAYTDASGNLTDVNGKPVTIPANSIVTAVRIVRTTAWDVLTSFTLGKSGDADWLANNDDHNLTGSAPGMETVVPEAVVTTATRVTAAWNQGAASEGAGVVIVEYVKYADS